MILTTEDFANHDICQRSRTYSARYEPFQVSLNFALNASLSAALATNNPAFASDKFVALAARPGIDLDAKNLYPAVIHHSRLVDLLATYALSAGVPTIPSPIPCEWGEFQPSSFLLGDRLRRIVLVDRWNKDRENLERLSWRTVADTAITNLPMTITAIVIGGSRNGFRPSPWTQGFAHPNNGGIRVLRRDGESFGDNWKTLFREQTDLKPLDWLRIMQQDGAFDGRVISITEDAPGNREEILSHLGVMAKEMISGSLRPTRSACFRFRPCPFLPACCTSQSPAQLGWIEKT